MSYERSPGRQTVAGTDASLTPEQRRSLRRSAATVAARTRDYLPGEFAIGTELAPRADGVRAYVAVRPPLGQPVTAGFEPDFDDEPLLDDDTRDEVARGLAASAALQVKQAMAEDDRDPVAR
ncbi:MAG: DUF5811 family protein [Halobacteriaceae archaeon]